MHFNRIFFITVFCSIAVSVQSQSDTMVRDNAGIQPVTVTPHKYPSLLWQVSGNGLKKPSYLYGTMHVSRKMVFRLTDSFFKALYSADVVALESDANRWIDELAEEGYGMNNYWDMIRTYGLGYGEGFYNSAFNVRFPKQSIFEYLLQSEEALADAMMYRSSDKSRNFSEEQFLDMFIHQAGMKLGKVVTGLEDYKISRKMVNRSQRPEPNGKKEEKKRKRIDYYGEEGVYEQIENAYRNGDLDLLDSLETLTAPGKNFLKWMLWERNKVMVHSFDSIVKTGKVLFAGIGAAHVPGDSGVVEMLRRKGYQVRPVFGRTTRWAEKQKDLIDERQYRHAMEPYVSHRGDFSATLPGTPLDYTQSGMVQYFYPDMANGAYYKITRLPYYGALSDQKPEFVLQRIDSLLFENVPGKIISKKAIVKNGHPGFDIQNKTSLGDYQRIMIIATPVNLWFIKLSGQREFARGKQSDLFFNSIQITEKTEDNWQRYSPPAGGYEVQWPTFVKRSKSKRDTSHILPGHMDMHAADKAGNYYFLRSAMVSGSDYYEEDTFELAELINSIAYDLKGEQISRQFETAGACKAIRASMYSNVARSKVYLKCVIMNRQFFLIGCKHADSNAAVTFLQSFRPVPFSYHRPMSVQTDSLLMFRTKTVEILNYGRPLKDEAEAVEEYYRPPLSAGADDGPYSETRDTLNINGKQQFAHYEYGEAEVVVVKRYVSGPFDRPNNLDSIYQHNLRTARRSRQIISKNEVAQKNGWTDTRWTVTDTGTSRYTFMRIMFREGDSYVLQTQVDSLTGMTPFVSAFIDHFEPIDSVISGPLPAELRTDSLLRGIFHPDSLIRRNHRQALVYFNDWKYKDVPAMLSALKRLNRFKTRELEQYTFRTLLNQAAILRHPDVLPYIKTLYYESADTAEQQLEVLYTLSQVNSIKASELLLELLLDETPLSEDYTTTAIFSNLEDTLKYSRPMFPRAFELLRYPEYKSHVLQLAAKMLDSGVMKPEDYLGYKSTLTMEFRDNWKRNMAFATTKSDGWDFGGWNMQQADQPDNEEGYGRYVVESTGSGFTSQEDIYRMYGISYKYQSRESTDDIYALGKLLMPWHSDPDVRKRLDLTWQKGKRPDRFVWVKQFLNSGKSLPDSVLAVFARRPDYRWELLSCTLPASADSLRNILGNERMMAESFIRSGSIGAADSMVLLAERKINYKNRKGTVYVFKHTFKHGYYDEWYLDMVLMPENQTIRPGKNDPVYWIRNRRMEEGKSEEKQVDEIMEYLMKHDRARWAPRTMRDSRRVMYDF